MLPPLRELSEVNPSNYRVMDALLCRNPVNMRNMDSDNDDEFALDYANGKVETIGLKDKGAKPNSILRKSAVDLWSLLNQLTPIVSSVFRFTPQRFG